MNTLLFLMRPDNYTSISSNFSEGYRNYALQDIVFDKNIDREKTIIVSTKLKTDRYKEIKILLKENGYNWLELDREENLNQLINHLKKEFSFDLDPLKTNVIYGGTSTSREVIHSTEFSINKFIEKGFNIQLYLPLCADVVQPGIFQEDRDTKAYSQLYSFIKYNNYISNIDILTRFADLKLPWKNR